MSVSIALSKRVLPVTTSSLSLSCKSTQQQLTTKWSRMDAILVRSNTGITTICKRTFSTNPSAKLSSTSKFNDLEPIDRKDNIIAVSFLCG
jgi:hypothetical protein